MNEKGAFGQGLPPAGGWKRYMTEDLCACETIEEGWRPCPTSLCERPDHKHDGVCPECGAETLPGERPAHNRQCSQRPEDVYDEMGRYYAALYRIASGPRPDGTYNLSREACEQIAKEALRERHP